MKTTSNHNATSVSKSFHYPITHDDFHKVYQGTDVHQQYTELKTHGQLFQKNWMFTGQPYTHIQFIDTIYLLDTPQEEDIPSLLVIIYDELDEEGEGAQPFFMTIRQIYTEYIKSHFTEKEEPQQ